MAPDLPALVCLAAAWTAYFVIHSALAADVTKATLTRAYPRLTRHYRWIYNALAAIALVPVFFLLYRSPGPVIWRWTNGGALAANGLAASALLGMIWTARYYDMKSFLGLKPQNAPPTLALSPIHRIVRHPWYFFALVIVWTRDFTLAWLVSAIMITAYLAVGSRLEERKLIAEFGARYVDYRRRVPGLIPLPWKFLRRTD